MVSPSATSIALRTNGARRDCHEFMRRFLQHVQGYGLWRWSRREHAAQARLGLLTRPSRWTGLSFISKCWLNTSGRLFFIERSLDTLPLVFI
jgi:hypothetical protein